MTLPHKSPVDLLDVRYQSYCHELMALKKIPLDRTRDTSLQIVNPLSGSLFINKRDGPESSDSFCDRFTLKIPYAQQTLSWEIIFDSENSLEPPDIIFDAEDSDFQPPLEDIKSLIEWDWRNTKSLKNLISELLVKYRDHQLQRASKELSVVPHMTSLISQSLENMEIIVNMSKQGAVGTINVLADLNVDCSSLPEVVEKNTDDLPLATLHVCLPHPSSSTLEAQLFLSPLIEKAIGGPNDLRIPTCKPGVLIGEYVENVTNLLNNQIKHVSEGFAKRRDFIAAFLLHFGKSVLEYDSESHHKIVLLLEWNDFFFTFTAEVCSSFPASPPAFTIGSVYHNTQNKMPYTQRYSQSI